MKFIIFIVMFIIKFANISNDKLLVVPDQVR